MTPTHAGQDSFERELAIEQAHVDRVYAQLEVAEASARRVQSAGRAIFMTDRADFVREEHGTALFERDAFAYQAAKRLAVLDAEHEGLVFGRIDLLALETRYIGRIGVRDDDYEPLVIDWRAPAAEPFYRATATAPMDVIRRRVLRCRDDKVIGIEDDLLDAEANSDLVVIGEGALMAALKRARGHNMRDIVATIQAEQDEAIRAPYQGVTLIAGGPGTGKTVVALHRAAYLLYTHRTRLEKGGVMVVGPSPIFMNYIERVLPSLGEDSVSLKPVGEVAQDVLGMSSDRIDPGPTATLKGSIRMLPVLRRLVQAPLYRVEQGDPLQISVKGEVLRLSNVELAAIRRGVLSGHLVNRARPLAEAAVLNALWAKLPADMELDRETFDDLAGSHASLVMFMNAWWPTLTPTGVLARLADPGLLASINRNALTSDEQQLLVTSYAPIARAMAEGTPDKQLPWTVADIALLDELAALIGPPRAEPDIDPLLFLEEGTHVSELVTTADLLRDSREVDPDEEPHSTYAHILVDESQDITPMQWRMLRRRGPQASWTLVGDPAQSSYPDANETEAALRELVGSAPRRDFRLSTNYRSPKEVFDLAARVVTSVFPDADLPHAVRTTGIPPELLVTTPDEAAATLDRVIGRLAGQVEGTIGLIVAPSAFDEVTAALAGLPGVESVGDRLSLMTAMQAKGLEYDAVVVLSPDDIVAEAPGGMRVLYVSLTRPTQRLVTIDLTDDRTPARWRSALL